MTDPTADRVRAAVHIADEDDVTDWQRGYRACAQRALAALEETPEPSKPASRRRCAHVDVLYGQCIRYLDDHDGECEHERQRCTCGDAGDCFAPAGHYKDCPKAGEES